MRVGARLTPERRPAIRARESDLLEALTTGVKHTAISSASVSRMSDATSGIFAIAAVPAYRKRSCGLLAGSVLLAVGLGYAASE